MGNPSLYTNLDCINQSLDFTDQNLMLLHYTLSLRLRRYKLRSGDTAQSDKFESFVSVEITTST